MKGQERSGRLLGLSLLAITNSCCSFLLLVMREKKRGRVFRERGEEEKKNGVGIMCREIESRLQRVGLLLTPKAPHRKCWEIDCSPSESVLFTLINLYSPG